MQQTIYNIKRATQIKQKRAMQKDSSEAPYIL